MKPKVFLINYVQQIKKYFCGRRESLFKINECQIAGNTEIERDGIIFLVSHLYYKSLGQMWLYQICTPKFPHSTFYVECSQDIRYSSSQREKQTIEDTAG